MFSLCVHVCVCIHTCLACMRTFVSAPISVSVCVYVYVCACVCACVCMLWPVAVWCRPIKTGEIDDQGLWVVAAAAVAVADSCFLQTTGNEMALFSWRCQHQHHRASKTNHHLSAAAGLLLHLPMARSPPSISLSLSNSTQDYLSRQS